MSPLDWVLVSLLISQQFFYQWQLHKLTDKLMSRDFTEYVRAKKPVPDRKPASDLTPNEDLTIIQEFRHIQ